MSQHIQLIYVMIWLSQHLHPPRDVFRTDRNTILSPHYSQHVKYILINLERPDTKITKNVKWKREKEYILYSMEYLTYFSNIFGYNFLKKWEEKNLMTSILEIQFDNMPNFKSWWPTKLRDNWLAWDRHSWSKALGEQC